MNRKKCLSKQKRWFRCIFYLLALVCLGLNSQVRGSAQFSGEDGASKINSESETSGFTLSNAIHLVVAGGTTGTYVLDGSIPASDANVLFLYFASVSPVYETTPTNFLFPYFDWRNESFFALTLDMMSSTSAARDSCQGGAKDQENIYRVQPGGMVTVKHPRRETIGFVCFSQDGINYTPTGITYEVLGIQLNGFFSLGTDGFDEWNPFPGISANSFEQDPELLEKNIGFVIGSSGAVQIISEITSYSVPEEVKPEWTSLLSIPILSHLRFSSTPDCSGLVSLFSPNIPVYRAGENFFFSFVGADVSLTREEDFFEGLKKNGFQQLMSYPFSASPTFFTCVAVQKSRSVDRFNTVGETFSVHDRLAFNASLTASLDEVTIYTLVPGLTGFLKNPLIHVTGMWTISPIQEEKIAVKVETTKKNRVKRYLIQTLPHTIDESGLTISEKVLPLSSSEVIHIPQFSTPIIALDSEGIQLGANLYLVRSPDECSASEYSPFSTESAVALSHLSVKAFSKEGEYWESLVFFQLSHHQTLLEGEHNENGVEWHACLSNSPYTPPLLLPRWKIIVHPEPFFTVDQSTDIVLHVSQAFAGPLLLPHLNTTLWSFQTYSTTFFSLSSKDTCDGEENPKTFQIIPSLNSSELARVFIPLNSFKSFSLSEYRLCVSLLSGNTFPTSVRIQLEPPQISFIEGADPVTKIVDLVFPTASDTVLVMKGYGLSSSSVPFLSKQPCSESVVEYSLLRFSIIPFTSYVEDGQDHFFLQLPPFSKQDAPRISSDEIQNLCFVLNSEETPPVIFGTPFKIHLHPRKVSRIENIPEEVSSFSKQGIEISTNASQPVVVYGGYVTLQIVGNSLRGAELMAAMDCSDSRSFLWIKPVQLIPALTNTEERPTLLECKGAFFCEQVWFAHLTPNETTQFHSSGDANELSFEWCIRNSNVANESHTLPYDSAGVRSKVIIPGFTGFLLEDGSSSNSLRFTSSNPRKIVRLNGPQISILSSVPKTSLHVLFLPNDDHCESYTEVNDTLPSISVSKHGEGLVDLRKFPLFSVYQLCYRVCFEPCVQNKVSYLSVPLDVMSVIYDGSFSFVSSLNGKITLSLFLDRSSLVTVEGEGLNLQTVLQLVPHNTSCLELESSNKARATGVPVFRRCKLYSPSGKCSVYAGPYEALFSASYVTSFIANVPYKVCFQNALDSPWVISRARITFRLSKGVTEATYWPNVENFLCLVPEVAVREHQSSSIRVFLFQQRTAVFSLWCNSNSSCPDGRRVSFLPLICPDETNLSMCRVSGDWRSNMWGPFSLSKGVFAVQPQSVKISKWWYLALETFSEEWKVVEDKIFYSASSDELWKFSSISQLPLPFNTTQLSSFLSLKRNEAYKGYISGFDVQGGEKIRFGALCEEEIDKKAMLEAGVDASNVSYLIRHRQELHNDKLYSDAILVEDASGAFFVPHSHVTHLQSPTKVCFSVNGGKNYTKLPLEMSITANADFVDNSAGIRGLLSETIFLLQGTSGVINVASVKGGNQWNFPRGTRIVASHFCGNDITLSEHVVLTFWPSTHLNVSQELTTTASRYARRHLCAVFPSTTSISNQIIDLGVYLYVLELRLTLLSEEKYFVASTDFDSTLELRLSRAARKNSCDGLTFVQNLLCLMEESWGFLFNTNLLHFRLTNSSCNSKFPFYEELAPSLSYKEERSEVYYSVLNASRIPAASLNDILEQPLCVSVDGGVNYLQTSIFYFSAGLEPTLLLQDHAMNFSQHLWANGDNLLFGALRDKRCTSHIANIDYNSSLCAFLTPQIWKGFLGTNGWVERGRWFMVHSTESDPGKSFLLPFQPQLRNRSFDSGVNNSFRFPELHCVEKEQNHVVSVHQSESGRLLFVPPVCGFGVTSETKTYLIKSNNIRSKSTSIPDPCLVSLRSNEMKVEVTEPSLWALAKDSSVAFRWPAALRFLVSGDYQLCVGNKSFSSLSLPVSVGEKKLFTSIGGVHYGDVILHQGSNRKLRIEGPVIETGQTTRIAFAPLGKRYVKFMNGTYWNWESGCSGLREVFSVEGASLLSFDQLNMGDLLLRTRPMVVVDKYVTIPATSVKHLNGDHPHVLCFSVNGGLSFNVVEGFRVVVVPSTINSLFVIGGVLPSFKPIPTASENALNVLHFVSGSNFIWTGSNMFVPTKVLPNTHIPVMTHTPLYLLPPFPLGFRGYGIGEVRELLVDEQGFKIYPTFVGSVAILRTSVVGSVCDKSTSIDKSGLVMPIFLLNMNTGLLWDPDDVEEGINLLIETNPVLTNDAWRKNTAEIIVNGGVNLLWNNNKNISDELDSESTWLVCLSVDGIHYYSPNYEQEQLNRSEDKLVSSPLIVVPESSDSGSTSPRDLAVVLTLLLLNRDCNETMMDEFSLSSVQRRLAHDAGVDPSILLVQLQSANCTVGLGPRGLFSIPIVVLSISVSSDTKKMDGRDTFNRVVSAPEVLYEVIERIVESSADALCFHRDCVVGLVGIETFFSNGKEIDHVIRSSYSKNSDWLLVFESFPKDGAVIKTVQDTVKSSNGDFLYWYQLPTPLFLITVVVPSATLVLFTIVVYRRYFLYEKRHEPFSRVTV